MTSVPIIISVELTSFDLPSAIMLPKKANCKTSYTRHPGLPLPFSSTRRAQAANKSLLLSANHCHRPATANVSHSLTSTASPTTFSTSTPASTATSPPSEHLNVHLDFSTLPISPPPAMDHLTNNGHPMFSECPNALGLNSEFVPVGNSHLRDLVYFPG